MPLENPEDFGIAADGFGINDYCHYCFREGAFTEPDITLDGMIDKCVGFMAAQEIMPETQARALMTEIIPQLKRWRST